MLGDIVASIHKRADSYFWKLVGDSPECLSTLMECKQHLMIHILGKSDLHDEDTVRTSETTLGASLCARSLGASKEEEVSGSTICRLGN